MPVVRENLLGAHIWADFSKLEIPLKKKLYRYAGARFVFGKGETIYHTFLPLDKDNLKLLLSDEHLMRGAAWFRPFLIDTVKMGLYVPG